MEKDWVRIYASNNFYQSEMVRQALAGNNIYSILLNKQDSAYHGFGKVEVYIHQEDFSNAVEVLIRNQINL